MSSLLTFAIETDTVLNDLLLDGVVYIVALFPWALICFFFPFKSDPEGAVWNGGSRCSDRGWKRDYPHLFRGRGN